MSIKQSERIAELEKALWAYANTDNWKGDGIGGCNYFALRRDGAPWNIARVALGEDKVRQFVGGVYNSLGGK